jgi:lysozyme
MYTISTKGIQLLKELEGTKLAAYQDTGGKWTIGTGHLIKPGEEYLYNGITEAKADELLSHDLANVTTMLNKNIRVPVTQSEVDSLIILGFNIGTGALRDSELLKLINQGAPVRAIVKRWTEHYITAGGVLSKGLLKRRAIEAVLWYAGKKGKKEAIQDSYNISGLENLGTKIGVSGIFISLAALAAVFYYSNNSN